MAGSAAGMQAEAVGTAPAQQAADQRSSTAQLKISINLAARSLALYRDTDKIRLYPIGPGAADTPTPVGYYKIQEKTSIRHGRIRIPESRSPQGRIIRWDIAG